MSERAEYDNVLWGDALGYVQRLLLAPESADDVQSEFSPKFVRLMLGAMLVSRHKYGRVAEGYPERVNAIDSLKKRLDKYRATGNVEFLVDVANFAMIEFMHPAHAKAHFESTDSSASPGRVAQNTDVYERPNQFKNTDLEPSQP